MEVGDVLVVHWLDAVYSRGQLRVPVQEVGCGHDHRHTLYIVTLHLEL